MPHQSDNDAPRDLSDDRLAEAELTLERWDAELALADPRVVERRRAAQIAAEAGLERIDRSLDAGVDAVVDDLLARHGLDGEEPDLPEPELERRRAADLEAVGYQETSETEFHRGGDLREALRLAERDVERRLAELDVERGLRRPPRAIARAAVRARRPALAPRRRRSPAARRHATRAGPADDPDLDADPDGSGLAEARVFLAAGAGRAGASRPLYGCESCGAAVYRRVPGGPPDRPAGLCLGCQLGLSPGDLDARLSVWVVA